ncbi:hypothetical protein RKD35_004799 [Streptomyces albogriseolus]
MTATPERVHLLRTFKSCRLGRADLRRLTEISTDGLNAADVTVSTDHNDILHSASNIDDLINAVQTSRGYDDRVPWDSFTIEGRGGSTVSADYRSVQVMVRRRYSHVSFSGNDHIWAHGQLARVQLFLANRNGKTDSVSSFRSVLWSASSFAAVVTTGPWFALVAVTLAARSNFLFNLAAAMFPFLLIAHCVNLLTKVANGPLARGKIRFTEDMPSGNLWQRMDLPNKIAFITLLFGGMAAIAATVSAGADIF